MVCTYFCNQTCKEKSGVLDILGLFMWDDGLGEPHALMSLVITAKNK